MAEGVGGSRNEVAVSVVTWPRDGHSEHHSTLLAQRVAELAAEANVPQTPFSCALYALIDAALMELTIEVMEQESEFRALLQELLKAGSEEEATRAVEPIDELMEALATELDQRREAAAARLAELRQERSGGQRSSNPMEDLIRSLGGSGANVTVIGPDGPMSLDDLEETLGVDSDPDLDRMLDDAGLSDEGDES
jgi:hypothetical protein